MARTTRSRKTAAEDVTAKAPAAVIESPALPEPEPASQPQIEPEPEPMAEAPAPEAAAELAPEVVVEVAPATFPAPPLAAAPRRFGVTLAVGLLAGALGVAVTLFAMPYGLRGVQPQGPDPLINHRLTQLEARAPGLDAAALTPLETRLAALETAPDLTTRLAALESAPAPEPVDLAPLTSRVAALESAPRAAEPQALATLEARMAALEAGIEARARAAVEAAVAESFAQTQAAARQQAADLAVRQQRMAERAALADLVAAAQSGAPAAQALAALPDAPAALAPLAEGLITHSALQDGFAPAARAALAAQPLPQDASVTDRITGFFRVQTGARSLAPREGGDPDAVLSRAEAAVAQAHLPAALAELGALTGEPAAAMADWIALARTRAAALSALATLQTQFED